MQALAAREQLAHGLRPTQQQQRQQRGLLAGQVEGAVQPVLVAFGAAGELLPRQAQAFQLPQGAVHHALFQCHQRLARGLLVGGAEGGIDGERVDIRGGGLLFHQAAEHPGLGGIEHGQGVGRTGVGEGSHGAGSQQGKPARITIGTGCIAG